jgi:hypothetical protein
MFLMRGGLVHTFDENRGKFNPYHLMRVGLVFTFEGRQIQSFSLLGETLGFALRRRKEKKAEVTEKEEDEI